MLQIYQVFLNNTHLQPVRKSANLRTATKLLQLPTVISCPTKNCASVWVASTHLRYWIVFAYPRTIVIARVKRHGCRIRNIVQRARRGSRVCTIEREHNFRRRKNNFSNDFCTVALLDLTVQKNIRCAVSLPKITVRYDEKKYMKQ